MRFADPCRSFSFYANPKSFSCSCQENGRLVSSLVRERVHGTFPAMIVRRRKCRTQDTFTLRAASASGESNLLLSSKKSAVRSLLFDQHGLAEGLDLFRCHASAEQVFFDADFQRIPRFPIVIESFGHALIIANFACGRKIRQIRQG